MSEDRATTSMASEAGTEPALHRIISSNLGEPSPRREYHEPLANDEVAAMQSELADAERAHADAAARLPSLYAG